MDARFDNTEWPDFDVVIENSSWANNRGRVYLHGWVLGWPVVGERVGELWPQGGRENSERPG